LDHTIRIRPDGNKNIEGDILFAHTGDLALCGKGRNKMKELAKTAIGHGVSATPLQMARIAATIATQKIVMPDLLSQYNHGLMASAPKHQSLYLSDLDALQKAMGKVVQHGKVKQVFSGYKGHQRIYGKTGTASMFENEKNNNKDKYNTTWFVGWQAPEHDTNAPLAFACMMTHAIHPNYRKGAEVSAPVIRDILKQIEKHVD
ncbi:Penicillin-binding protein, transpeptidase domain protein, partial [Candidatus Magnetomorum sp. HK-1]